MPLKVPKRARTSGRTNPASAISEDCADGEDGIGEIDLSDGGVSEMQVL